MRKSTENAGKIVGRSLDLKRKDGFMCVSILRMLRLRWVESDPSDEQIMLYT